MRTFFESWCVWGPVTPLSLLASAQWGYLKCTLSERNVSLLRSVGRADAGAMNLRPYMADAQRCDVSVWANHTG
jgi:hypothetical protein